MNFQDACASLDRANRDLLLVIENLEKTTEPEARELYTARLRHCAWVSAQAQSDLTDCFLEELNRLHKTCTMIQQQNVVTRNAIDKRMNAI